jgi:hypothetical protein
MQKDIHRKRKQVMLHMLMPLGDVQNFLIASNDINFNSSRSIFSAFSSQPADSRRFRCDEFSRMPIETKAELAGDKYFLTRESFTVEKY